MCRIVEIKDVQGGVSGSFPALKTNLYMHQLHPKHAHAHTHTPNQTLNPHSLEALHPESPMPLKPYKIKL